MWAMYISDNWRAFRTWGVSARNAWGYSVFWELRDGAKRQRQNFKVDWDNLQKPGISPDYFDTPNDLAFETALDRDDWIPTKAAEALIRNNMPLLAYIAGKPAHFTTKEHNYLAGQTVQKQVVIINDSRATVDCDSSWSLGLPESLRGSKKLTIPAGQQERIPLSLALPADIKSGRLSTHAYRQILLGRNPGGHVCRSTSWPPAAAQADFQDGPFRSQGRNGPAAHADGRCDLTWLPRTPIWAATAYWLSARPRSPWTGRPRTSPASARG